MELADYLKVFRRRWWMIVLAVAVCTMGAVGFASAQTPRYTSTTRLLVSGASAGGAEAEGAARRLASERAAVYAMLIQTGPGLGLGAQQAGVLSERPQVVAEATPDSPFIVISASANTAQAAQRLAAAYEKAIPVIVRTLERAPASAIPQITTLEPAAVPASPSSPKPLQDVPIAFTLGLILGLAAAFLREALDVRVRETAELEELAGATLLGSVPREHPGETLPAVRRPQSARTEAYRHVRTNLEFVGSGGMPQSVVITSAGPGEGKSSLAANLAVVAAYAGRRVVIVDADLRKPAMARYFGVQARGGLADVLGGRCVLRDVLTPVADRLTLLPSGAVPSYPSELLGSMAMRQVVEVLEQEFDLVVIDTPPVLPVPDALLVGVHAGGTVVVARMTETRRAALRRAIEAVRKVNVTLLGIVGNAVVRHEEKPYGRAYGQAYGIGSGSEPYVDALPVQLAPASRRGEELDRPRRARRRAADPDEAAVTMTPPADRPWPPAHSVAVDPEAANGHPFHAFMNGHGVNGATAALPLANGNRRDGVTEGPSSAPRTISLDGVLPRERQQDR